MVAEPVRRDEFEQALEVLQHLVDAQRAQKDVTDLLAARLDVLDGKVDALEARLDALDAKVDALDAKFTARLDGQDRRLDAMDGKLDALRRDVAEILRRLPEPPG